MHLQSVETTVWKKREILSHRKNISWNQPFSIFCRKNIDFTKFLSMKNVTENFRNLHIVEMTKLLSSFFNRNSVKSTSRNIFPQIAFRIIMNVVQNVSHLVVQVFFQTGSPRSVQTMKPMPPLALPWKWYAVLEKEKSLF